MAETQAAKRPEVLTDTQKWLARMLFDIGAVQFGAFKLKLHEKEPNAPLSPIFFNLRTKDNPKPGPLGPEIVAAIGNELYQLAKRMGIEYTVVAGIPNAGDPLADAFIAASKGGLPKALRFGKKVIGEKREVIGLTWGKVVPGDIVLFIDDLVTKADTKIEALAAGMEAGLRVRDIVVLIDRMQGGTQQLAKFRYRLHALFPVQTLLDFYLAERRITATKLNEVMFYLTA